MKKIALLTGVALLLSAVVGFLASVAALGLNIKGKNHIATALGAIALIISVMSLAILGASLVRFITMELPRMLGNFIVPLIVYFV